MEPLTKTFENVTDDVCVEVYCLFLLVYVTHFSCSENRSR